MDLSLTAVYSALSASQTALEAEAQDLANVRTPGYRPQVPYFESALAVVRQGGDGGEVRLPWGVKFQPGGPSTEPGPLSASRDPVHAALSHVDDYFCVQTPQGVAYTRDGSFHLDAEGRLLDAHENPVLGEDGPLKAESGKGRILSDGTFDTGATGAPQKLKLVNLAGLKLDRRGGQMFTVADGREGAPGKGGLLPGEVEGSGADTFKGMSELVMLLRWSESVQKAARASDDAAGAMIQSAKIA